MKIQLVTVLSRAVLAYLVAACGLTEPASSGPDPSGLRFYEDVAPIFAKHCVGCHREGGAGGFSLVSHEDAVSFAASMPAMVRTRQMPPFAADNSGACNTYQDARWLSDDEIATIAAWAEGERQIGDPAAAPALPEPPGLPRVDATAAMAVPYTTDPARGDDHRCFVVDPGLAQDAFLTGFEVRPGEPAALHHILLIQIETAAAEAAAEQLDAQSAEPGYACNLNPGTPGLRLLGTWAPGMRVAKQPEGTGLLVRGGRKMLLQIHYHGHGQVLTDRTAVDLMLEPTVAAPSFFALLGAAGPDLPPGQPAIVTSSQAKLADSVGRYNIRGVFAHMHARGHALRVEVDHAGQTECITDVSRWDPKWEQSYFYDGPPRVAGGGDTLRIRCVHDTSEEDQPITWGDGADQEMCLALLYVSAY